MRANSLIASLPLALILTACGGNPTPLSQAPSDMAELTSENCSANHPYVGRSVELSTFAHGVAGTVTIIDDCQIEITNFSYDGLGPSVYFYGGNDGSYIGEDAFSIGPQLNGRSWNGESLTLVIPEGKSLDDFNSVSVWCFDFNANFGDAFFGDS